MRMVLKVFFALLIPFAGMAQDFSRAEYFFDTDPGAGNGTAINLTLTSSPLSITTTIPTSSLTPGFHHLGIRLKAAGGPWSIFEPRGFYISTSTANSPSLSAAEYFFDSDPGAGNGTSIPITPGDVTNFTINLPISSLSAGFHFLAIRTKGSDGKWGVFDSRGFYISTATTDVPNITAAEYFFDGDPGAGNGTSIPVVAGSVTNFTVSLPTTSLSPGFHFLAIRTKGSNGKWGIFESRGFYISSSTNDVSNIVAAEYFFDNDPGVGNATSIPITAGANVNFTASLPVTGLSKGFHFLAIRTKGSDGTWGLFESRGFYVSEPNVASNIVAAEYFFDTDPGIGSAEPLTVNPIAPDISQTFTIPVPNTLTIGDHYLFVRAQDSEGSWSEIVSDTLTILNCTPPAAPVTTGNSRCGAGPVILTASGALATHVYRWYDDATTLIVTATGSAFTTPSLDANKTYYASIYDPATTCESSRVATIATVTIFPKPDLNISGDISFCEGGSIFLSAPSGFSNYLWSTGQTTQQIVVIASGEYSVQAGTATCLSEASDTVEVTTISPPPKPVITVDGNTTICGTGSVDLTGPPNAGYIWSTGATTQTITVSQAGVYFLIVTSGGSCPSFPSDPVVVTVLTPPCDGGGPTNQSPVINNSPLACNIEGTLVLDLTTIVSDPNNNLDFTTLKLLSSTTARGASASVDGSYNLTINYSGLPFTGTDRITLEVCDLSGACVQQVIDIELVGAVVVYNGVTPDGDGKNDFLLLKYVDVVEGAQQNKVTILNRWGDIVFDVSNYNNDDRAFRGSTNNGSDLPSGTYFYKVDFPGGLEPLSGFLTLIR